MARIETRRQVSCMLTLLLLLLLLLVMAEVRGLRTKQCMVQGAGQADQADKQHHLQEWSDVIQ